MGFLGNLLNSQPSGSAEASSSVLPPSSDQSANTAGVPLTLPPQPTAENALPPLGSTAQTTGGVESVGSPPPPVVTEPVQTSTLPGSTESAASPVDAGTEASSGGAPSEPQGEVTFTDEEVTTMKKEAEEKVNQEKQKPHNQFLIGELQRINPEEYKYHNLSHAEDFAREAAFLAVAEKTKYGADISDQDLADLITLGYFHDIKYTTMKFGTKGLGHEEAAVADSDLVDLLKTNGYFGERIKLIQALTICTQLRPADFTVPTEDFILSPLPWKEIYDRFQLQGVLSAEKFEVLAAIARDSDLSNVGRQNSLQESGNVYYDENRTAPGKPGFKPDDYRDFMYRTWNGVLGPNGWRTRTAKKLYSATRDQNLEEIRLEAVKWAEFCEKKNSKIKSALTQPKT